MVPDVIASGIRFLQTQQQNDGSFLSLSSPSPLTFQKALTFHSTFSTALILSSLTHLEETSTLATIKQKAAAFLISQKSEHGSFNYWTRNSEETKTMPYPDDLDDTFCALAALFQYDPRLIDGAVMAKVVMLLTALEKKEGGPYRTWLVPEDAAAVWRDIDVAVNSNVAYFLSLVEIDLPNVTKFIEKCIEQDKLISPYYPTIYPIIYFIARFYRGEKKQQLVEMLLVKRNKKQNWGNPLDTALGIASLLNLKIAPNLVEKNISYLIQTQKNGSWEPYPFYTGVNPKRDHTYYAGSSALTTAFCLEALAKYLTSQTHVRATEKRDTKASAIRNHILQNVRERFAALSQEFTVQGETMLTKILAMDEQHHILLLPYLFQQSLGAKGESVTDVMLITLGAANVYGWMAYTIYDDFLDEEGKPTMLPVANIALREVTTIFQTIVLQGFKLFSEIMDELDEANAWEVTNCRDRRSIPKFGNYEMLAQKSLGHALGPLAIVSSLGFTEKSSEVKNLRRFFTHYLIARQLNDDAHDWEEDLKKEHISPVVAMLLKAGDLNKRKLQEFFWYDVLVEVCHVIQKHLRLARKSLDALTLIVDRHMLEGLLVSLEHAAQEALDEREKTIGFLTTYERSAVS